VGRRPSRLLMTPFNLSYRQWRIQDFCKGVRQLVPLECPKPLHALSPSDS